MIRRHRRTYKCLFLVTICISLISIAVFSACATPPPSLAPGSTPSSPKIEHTVQPPHSPSNLIGEPASQSIVNLQWTDNSDNEDGFKIYRDNMVIATVGINVTIYQNTGLKPSTTYQYVVKAYNQAGESGASLCTVRTPNPPITVRLDRIGVYDNRETWTRGKDGEVYVYIIVSDGKKTTERMRFPQQEGQHYKLEKNETVDIGTIIFSTNEIGDSLTLTAIGFEDDGGGFEPLVYKALGVAIESQIAGGAGGLLKAFGFSIGGLIAQLAGTEDDWLGSYERTWNRDNNWGIGGYIDIACKDEREVQCLRLWFTITSP